DRAWRRSATPTRCARAAMERLPPMSSLSWLGPGGPQQRFGQRPHVLIAAPRHADQDARAGMRAGPAPCAGERVRALDRRQDAFALAALAHRRQRLRIARGLIAHAADRS